MKGILKVVAWAVITSIVAFLLYLALISGLERQANILESESKANSMREEIEKICIQHYDYNECIHNLTNKWAG